MMRTRVGRSVRATDNVDIEGRPAHIARAKLTMVNGHVLCTNCLRVDAVEKRNRAAGENARGYVARFGGLLGGFGNDGDWG